MSKISRIEKQKREYRGQRFFHALTTLLLAAFFIAGTLQSVEIFMDYDVSGFFMMFVIVMAFISLRHVGNIMDHALALIENRFQQNIRKIESEE